MDKEIWKDIPAYEGYYQVSNLGRVRAVPRDIRVEGRGVWSLKDRILKQSYTNRTRRYYHVVLSKDNKTKTYRVHRLVAMAFLFHDENSGLFIDHIDNDPTNNRLDNLQLVTPRENVVKDTARGPYPVGVTKHKS